MPDEKCKTAICTAICCSVAAADDRLFPSGWQNYNELIGDWQGHGAWELFRFWGQPEAVYRLPNDRRVAVFGNLDEDDCVTEFEFDENGNVARATATGNCEASIGDRIMLAAPDKPKVK